MTFFAWCASAGGVLALCTMGYAVVAYIAVAARPRSVPYRASAAETLPPVTLLKPLCGVEPETYDCLRSFCAQAYPHFQIVFGVSDANDPAVALVRRLQAEFPARDLELVIDSRQHGYSRKVSNLINMMASASHDLLVLSDSDVRVGRDYLSRLVEPLMDPGVGIVTCTYRGVPRRGFWSLLGAMYINEWFMPSVRVAALVGSREFAFGATIGIRGEVLSRIGGFAAIADQLADDYRLGEMTRKIGLRTVLSSVEVDTFVIERSFRELAHHELRWLRTIRAVRPMGYALSFITFSLPIAAIGALMSHGSTVADTAFGFTLLARILLHMNSQQRTASAGHWLALPFRDLLTLGLWAWSFSTRCVQWREDRYVIARDGSVLPILRT